MSEGFIHGGGGGKSEGKYAWKKRIATASFGSSTNIDIRTDGYGQTTLTMGDSILIRADGSAVLTNTREVPLQGSPYLYGYFFYYSGVNYANTTGSQYTNSNGVPYCVFNATRVTTSAPVTSCIVDDDPNKFTQTTAPPGKYIYERIS